MPQIKPRKNAKGDTRYTALVRYKGLVASQTFSQRKQAEGWGNKVELALDGWIREGRPVEEFDLSQFSVKMRGERRVEAEAKRAAAAPAPKPKTATVREVLEWYQDTFTATKAESTRRREDGRVRLLIKHLGDIAAAELTISDLDRFVEARQDVASSQTIKNDAELLASAFKENRKLGSRARFPEIAESPLFKIWVRPEGGNERERRLAQVEEEAIWYACETGMCGYAHMRQAIELAIETAMRQSELTGIRWRQYNPRQSTITLSSSETKTGAARTVPLSLRAIEVLESLPQGAPDDYVLPGLTARDRSMSLRGYFIRLIRDINARVEELKKTPMADNEARKKLVTIDNFVWHDLRHEATSRFFERTDLRDTEIMKITGHKSYTMLQRYANLRVGHIVKMLQKQTPATA